MCAIATEHVGGIPCSLALHNKWQLSCPRCDFQPSTTRDLSRHLNTDHRDDRGFRRSLALPRRPRGRTTPVTIRTCPYCSFMSVDKGDMVSHVRCHEGILQPEAPPLHRRVTVTHRRRSTGARRQLPGSRVPSVRVRGGPSSVRSSQRRYAAASGSGGVKRVTGPVRRRWLGSACRGRRVTGCAPLLPLSQNTLEFLQSRGPHVLPYKPNSLHWNTAGTRNREGKYCYCGKDRAAGAPPPMLQCSSCSQFFHAGALGRLGTQGPHGVGGCCDTCVRDGVPSDCVTCLDEPLAWGDTEYDFWCSVCGGGYEVFQPYPKVCLRAGGDRRL